MKRAFHRACISLLAALSLLGFTSALASASDQIAVSTSNVCALKSGEVWCWGDNYVGATGHEDFESWLAPRRVTGLQSGVTQIDNSGITSCAIVSGAVKCWGSDYWGQLGSGSPYPTERTTPQTVTGLTSGATQVSVNGGSACAVVSGAVKCWGDGLNGALGDGISHEYPNRLVRTPVSVAGLGSGATVTKVSTGSYGGTTCVVVDGAAKCWGSDERELLGNGAAGSSLTPVSVSGLASGVTDISMSTERACAIKSATVFCWGARHGVYGYDDVPVEVPGFGSGATEVSTGYDFDCAVVAGATKCVGVGRLGDGTVHETPAAVTVAPLSTGSVSASTALGIACGMNAAVYCWGWPELTDSLFWAIDLSPTPLAVDFDTEPPGVSVDGPAIVTTSTAAFNLDSDEGVDFECALDDQSFSHCETPWTRAFYSAMNGPHKVRVRGTDFAGNISTEEEHAFAVNIADSPGNGTQNVPPYQPPYVSPARLVAVAATLRLKRSKNLVATLSIHPITGGPFLLPAQCPHTATLTLSAKKLSIMKPLSLSLRSGVCTASKSFKLPRNAAKKSVKVFAYFQGNDKIASYSATKNAKPVH